MPHNAPFPFSKIAILGPGLMGGSLLLALRERYPQVARQVWARRAASLEPVRNLADLATLDPVEAVRDCDCVILCTPIETMASLAERFRPGLSPGVLVTDVGSVKGLVIDQVAEVLGREIDFFSSHPMAGSDQDGFDAAHSELYEGAPCILTPVQVNDLAARQHQLTLFWEALGMRIAVMDAQTHDAAVAMVSHLPHVAAAALVNQVLETGATAMQVTGSGWRDTTRVASGATQLWTEILAANHLAVSNALEQFAARILEASRIIRMRDTSRIETWLESAKQGRDAHLNDS